VPLGRGGRTCARDSVQGTSHGVVCVNIHGGRGCASVAVEQRFPPSQRIIADELVDSIIPFGTQAFRLSCRSWDIAAEPLEDYLVKCGDQVIAKIEALAASDPKFQHLLRGVWKNSMSDEVWERVWQCRGEPW
jgi:hypothetical protein